MPDYAGLIKFPIATDMYNSTYGEPQWWRDFAVTARAEIEERAAEANFYKSAPATGSVNALAAGYYEIDDPELVTDLPSGAEAGQLLRAAPRDIYVNNGPGGTVWERRMDENGLRLPWSKVESERTVPLALTRPLGTRVQSVTARSVRIPFSVPARVKNWRIKIRNINYRTNTEYPGSVTLNTVNIGTAGIDENGQPTSTFTPSNDFSQGMRVLIRDVYVNDMGSGWTSAWGSDELRPGVHYLLSFGYQTDGQDVQSSMGGGWQTNGAPTNAELPADPTATLSDRLPFDVSIELVMQDEANRDVVIGDSISAASNATFPVFESPASIAGRQTGRMARLYTFGGAAFGEWFGGAWADPTSLKWQEILLAGRADRAIIALGNNDIHAGDSLATLKGRIETAAQILKERVATNVMVCTVTPRTAWPGTSKETVREQFNDWIRTFPAGITGVADTARAVEDSTGHAPRADYVVEDGIHFNTMGSTALAAAIASPYSPGNADGDPLTTYLNARGV